MKRIIQLALSLSCVLGLAMGQPAFAAQFNVTVPINLNRLPADVTHVIVKGFLLCGPEVSRIGGGESVGGPRWNDQPGETAGGRRIVGVGQQIRSINTATGEFHSSITLGLNVAQGYYPNNVGVYFYRFRLQRNGQVIDPGQMQPGSTESGSPVVEYVQFNRGAFTNPALYPQASRCDSLDFFE